VLKELGVKIDVPVPVVERCLDEIGVAFLFAPRFHPAMKKVGAVRRQLGIKTAFNVLGPLTNPAGAAYQIIGVFQAGLTELMAEVLRRLDSKRAWVFHSQDGMDEISVCDETKITELKDGHITTFMLSPRELNLPPANARELCGADSRYNAEITRGVLSGEIKAAPRSVVVLNAAAGLLVSGKAQDLKSALAMAEASIDSGAALKKLEALKKLTNDVQ
jgi:anthranilate phosphoribosyltransferase